MLAWISAENWVAAQPFLTCLRSIITNCVPLPRNPRLRMPSPSGPYRPSTTASTIYSRARILNGNIGPTHFFHLIRLLKWIPENNQTMSPYEIITGVKTDLSDIRTSSFPYGIRLPYLRSNRLTNSTHDGIIIGYTATIRNVWW